MLSYQSLKYMCAMSHPHIFTYPRCLTQQSVKGKILPTIVWHSVQIWSVCFVVSKKNGTKKNGKNKIGLKSSSWLISQVTPILIIHVKAQGWVDVLVLTSVCWQCGHWGITVGWREVRKFWMSTATVESPIWRSIVFAVVVVVLPAVCPPCFQQCLGAFLPQCA